MAWTRRQFIVKAFAEIGIGGDFEIQPAELEDARASLDAMMAEWNARGLRLGYPIGADPTDGDLDDVTGVPDAANQAVYLNLAIILAPSYGRTPMPTTMANARRSLSTVEARAAQPRQMQYPAQLPRGAGAKAWRYRRPFYPRPEDPILAGSDGPIDFT